jgi:carboxymethylenebutenolidase
MSIHRDASPGCASSDFAWEVGFALLLAADHGFGAASVNYGGPPAPDAETFLSRACPIVGSYGGKDPWNRSVAQKLEETLAGTGIAHDVKEYPEAGHSFLKNHETSFFKMLQIIHIAYDEPAAKDARRRIVSFFREHLGS